MSKRSFIVQRPPFFSIDQLERIEEAMLRILEEVGAREFGVVGTLSLDELFSAEQLIYDLEIKDHVQRLVEGIDGDCDPERCLKDVMEGLQQKSFVGLDTTLNGYRHFYWHPRLFERQFLAAWEREGAQTIHQRTHAMIRELLSQHEYELEPEPQKELDKILARAEAEDMSKYYQPKRRWVDHPRRISCG